MPDLHEPNPPVDEDGTDDLAALRAIGRRVAHGPSEGWEAPPDGLWDRIEAEALPGAHADRPGPTDPTADAAGVPVDAPPAASSVFGAPPPLHAARVTAAVRAMAVVAVAFRNRL